jgi:putative protease
MPNIPEVLAPAGDWECIKAAVANGADAVYFGLTSFNARHRAHNFEPDELPAIMQYLHERGVKGYVTFNILIFAQELPAAIELLTKARDAQVDAVIVQDMGLAYAIQQLLPGLVVHGSTQMTLTEPLAINLVKKLGVERVILARELSTTEVGKIHQATAMPLEVFVHGALCVAYSGQCLTSEALGGRSANRGQCAQACRLPYELIVDGEKKELGDRAYLLSPQDLAAHELVPSLIDQGVVSFKIEGRLKKADYVAATVQAYRQAIDGQPLGKQQKLELEQTFSRGLTQGFLGGINHQTLVPARSPKKRGVKIGTVQAVQGHVVLVQLADTTVPLEWLVKAGDGIVFDEGKPEGDEVGGRVWKIKQRDKQRVEITLDRQQFQGHRVHAGNIVWKTDDPALRKKLEKSYTQDKPSDKKLVTATIIGKLGGTLTLQFSSPDGLLVSSTWPGPLEKASKHPATLAMIREQLGRLHDTPFELADIKLKLDPQLMIPKSILNELRRRALVDLLLKHEEQLQQFKPKPFPQSTVTLSDWRAQLKDKTTAPAAVDEPQLAIMVRTLGQLNGLIEYVTQQPELKPQLVYCDFEDVRQYREAVTFCKEAKLPVGVATLRVIKPGEESWLKLIASYGPDFILARNLTSVAYYSKNASHIPLLGDFSLNVANDITAHWMRSLGLQRLTPGFDLNWEQLQALVAGSHPGLYEVVVHYHMPMFHNEHCVFAALLSDGKDWRDCGRPCDRHKVELKDRSSAVFPVLVDAGCRNTVYNALPQSAAEFIPAMLSQGIRHFRIEMLREDPNQIGTLLESYWRILRGQDDGKTAWKKLQATQQLGVTRGTLQVL